MKTRRFFLYLIIYVGINLFASCENEIPYTPPYREPQLIMNALLDAGEHENFVFLSVSGIERVSHMLKLPALLFTSMDNLPKLPKNYLH